MRIQRRWRRVVDVNPECKKLKLKQSWNDEIKPSQEKSQWSHETLSHCTAVVGLPSNYGLWLSVALYKFIFTFVDITFLLKFFHIFTSV